MQIEHLEERHRKCSEPWPLLSGVVFLCYYLMEVSCKIHAVSRKLGLSSHSWLSWSQGQFYLICTSADRSFCLHRSTGRLEKRVLCGSPLCYRRSDFSAIQTEHIWSLDLPNSAVRSPTTVLTLAVLQGSFLSNWSATHACLGEPWQEDNFG